MDTFYKELLKIREDFDGKNRDLADWKTKLSTDLLNFYKKYDTQFIEASAISKQDKENLNTLINEMTDNISKSKQGFYGLMI